MLEDRALAVVNGDFYVMDLMTLVIMPISLTMMIGSVIIAPIYMVYLMTQLPHIIYCLGRVANPDYPECLDRDEQHRLPNLNLNQGHRGEGIGAVVEGEHDSDGSTEVNFDEGI